MSSEEREHTYAFVVTLLFIFAATGNFIYNSSISITGYATYESLSDTCKSYFGDKICDDSSADCGGTYQSGNSLDECDECQTIKDGKLGYPECGGSGKVETNSCKDSCGGKSKTGSCWCDAACLNQVPPDCCSDYSTCQGIVPPPSSEKPNLYVSSLAVKPGYGNEPGTIIKQTGIYGKKGVSAISQIIGVFGLHPQPTSRFYEINEDNSIIETSKGYNQEVTIFHIYYEISNNGKPTQNEFKVKLQKLKKDSAGWETLGEGKLVLLEPKNEAYVQIFPNKLDNIGINKLRIVVDTENKIAESNEEDNSYLFEINLKAI